MKVFSTVSAAFGLVGLASAHMEMKNPPPFRSKFNTFTTDIDYSMTNPLSRDGGDFPCKGYHSLVGTPQGRSVTTWAPGSTQTLTVTGGTPHNGGSCQASLSYDGGSTWKAIHSYYGNCPVQGDSSYTFALPNDTPAGEALFAWTWFNQIGNREMYMNCAVVTIGASAAKRDLAVRGPQDSFNSRPAMFVANVGNGCSTTEGTDVEFPNAGPDVTNNSAKLAPPVGNCAARSAPIDAPNPTSKRSVSVSPTPPPAPSSAAPPPTTTIPSTFETSVIPDPSEIPSSQSDSPGGVFMTVPDSAPSTLSTVTRPAPTESVEEPTAGAFEVGATCDNEGAWNCVEGTEYQRCASGSWSVLQAVYPGTHCEPGVSAEILLTRSKSPAPNYVKVLRASRALAEAARN